MLPRARLSSADASLDAYAGLAAHQVGEAVALLRASASVLQAGRDRPTSAISDAMPSLIAGTERAQRFVDDLLGLTAVTRSPAQPELVDMGDVLDEACTELGVALARTGAKVRANDLPPLLMDPGHARLALVHLLRVALAADAQTIDVRVVLSEAGETATIEVVDDGATIAAGIEDQAFEAFARTRGRGPLLGADVSLVLCRRVAEAHGGTTAIHRFDDATTLTILSIPQRR